MNAANIKWSFDHEHAGEGRAEEGKGLSVKKIRETRDKKGKRTKNW